MPDHRPDPARATRRRKEAERRHRPGGASAQGPNAGKSAPGKAAAGKAGAGKAGAGKAGAGKAGTGGAGTGEPVRLNRFLARAGVASRREADDIISAGRVAINGQTVTELGVKVTPEDRVTLDGRAVSPKGPVYVLLNKPKDTITTTEDERGRRTVMDLVALGERERAGLFPVGRLDRDTTGAILLTNDGDLAHRLMHPRYRVDKLYLVRTARPVQADEVEQLRKGLRLEDGPARADQVGFVTDDRSEVALSVHEGRNRLVRRMFEALGHEVVALDRIGYAGLTLAGLRRGKWRRLEGHEVNTLRSLVKLKAVVFKA